MKFLLETYFNKPNSLKTPVRFLACHCLAIWFFAQPVASQSSKNVHILTTDQVFKMYMEEGLEMNHLNFFPMYLLELDTTMVDTLVDIELRKRIENPTKNERDRFFWEELPAYSIEVAQNHYAPYAAQKLFEFYRSLPIRVISDKTFRRYSELDKVIGILVYYKPNGVTDRLIKDFYEWKKLATTTKPKKYKSLRKEAK